VLGAITDDTQMTLFTAEGMLGSHAKGLLGKPGEARAEIHRSYLRWLSTQGELKADDRDFLRLGWLIEQKQLFARRAPGVTCIGALKTHVAIGQAARNDSKGCGGVMRVAPIGMLFQALSAARPELRDDHLRQAFDLACDAAALTHGHPTGQLPAGALSAIVFLLLEGQPLRAATDVALGMLKHKKRHEETFRAMRNAVELADSAMEPAGAIRSIGEGWVAEEALAIGLYCALAARDFEAGVVMAVNHDGDSDSTGLIAGHLLGAMYGLESIPDRWLRHLELREVIEEVADNLASVGR
jgi:ADP-ribosylglycohydrolase